MGDAPPPPPESVRTFARSLVRWHHYQIFSAWWVTNFSYPWCFAGTLPELKLRYKFGLHTSANSARMKNSSDLIFWRSCLYCSHLSYQRFLNCFLLNGYDFYFDHMAGENRELRDALHTPESSQGSNSSFWSSRQFPLACISEVPERQPQVWETAQGLFAVVQWEAEGNFILIQIYRIRIKVLFFGNLPLSFSEHPHSFKVTCFETAHIVIHWCQIDRCSFHLLKNWGEHRASCLLKSLAPCGH